jgi:hypothetical protein
MPFTSYDSIISAIQTSGQTDLSSFNKNEANVAANNCWHQDWQTAGFPIAGGIDATGTQYVNGSGGSGASANYGGLNFSQISVSTKTRHALSFGLASSQNMLYDRLCGIGNLSVTSTGSITLSTLPALPRYTNGVGVQAWVEVTNAFSTTAPVFYLNSYTGTSSASGTSAGSSNTLSAPQNNTPANNVFGPFPLAAGDIGVKQISSIYVSTASSSGIVKIILLYPLAVIPVQVNTWNERDFVFQSTLLPQIYDGASLGMMVFNTSAAATYTGYMLSAYA